MFPLRSARLQRGSGNAGRFAKASQSLNFLVFVPFMKTPGRIVSLLCGCLAGMLLLPSCGREAGGLPVTKAASTNIQPPEAAKTNVTEQAQAPTQKVPPVRVSLPPAVDEVVDLSQAGVGDPVVLEFVKNSTNAYELSVDEIVYLKDLGVSEQVLAGMVHRGNELRQQAAKEAEVVAANPPANPPPSEPAQPPPAEVAQAQPAPAPAPAPPSAPSAEQSAVAQAQPAPPQAEAPQAAPVQVVQVPTTQYVAPAAPAPVTSNYFYDTLSPYGTWVDLPGYGWCWQPTCSVIDPGWRPYSHGGHWIYTDSGWYWYSDYSWGWAPFHYGRWHRSPVCGWVWVPGSVWGPAWVTWRNYDTYCGWAPLPPEASWDVGLGLCWHGSRVSFGFGFGLGWDHYSFVSYHHMHDPFLHRHFLPRHEIVNVYDHSTVINIAVGHNHTVMNGGIARDRMRAVTRHEIPVVRIRDTGGPGGGSARPERLNRNGAELAVYRPQLPANLARQPARAGEPSGASSRPLQGSPARVQGERGGGSSPAAPLTPRAARELAVSPGATPASVNARASRSETPLAPRSQAVSKPATTAGRSGVQEGARGLSERAPSSSSTATPSRTTAPDRSTPAASRQYAPLQPRASAPASSTVRSEGVRTPSTASTPSSAPAASTAPAQRQTYTAPSSQRSVGSSAPSTPSRSSSVPTPSTSPAQRQTYTAPSSQPSSGSITRSQAEPTRAEPRKIESARPSSQVAPKFSASPSPSQSYTSPSASPRSAASAPSSGYSAPAPSRGYSAPAQSYSPPAMSRPSSSAPSPSYSPPAASRPTYSAPARSDSSSSGSRSSSPGSSSGSRGGPRN